MSQQTPVARIVEPWRQWLARWPTPGDLAADSPGEAIRMWGRLGYPRRALRLHGAATAMVERHGGEVPGSVAHLLALPGIGAYTAAAAAAFGFGIRTTVLDVNIRRVLARVAGDTALPAGSPTRAEVDRAAALLPPDPTDAVTWNAAVMELGALVCVARTPHCPQCPLADICRTGRDGAGAAVRDRTGSRRGAPQPWVGTDRYVRGLIMARLRESQDGIARAAVDLVWPDETQVSRCLAGLLTDGLAVEVSHLVKLPG